MGTTLLYGFNKEQYNTFDINLDTDIILRDKDGIPTTANGNFDFPRDVSGNPIINIFLSGIKSLILYTDSGNTWIQPSGKGDITFINKVRWIQILLTITLTEQ